MPHNDPKEVVLNEFDERELRLVGKRIAKKKQHLSFFERQEALALGKSLDVHGNLDLNENANQATQLGSSKRINPNVLASYSDNKPAVQDTEQSDGVSVALDEANKAARGTRVFKRDMLWGDAKEIHNKSLCAHHCRTGEGLNKSGRTNCRWCHGEGYIAKTERLGRPNSPHRSRHIVK
jgi:hypothetical protein